MKIYDPQTIEEKWRNIWKTERAFEARKDYTKKKFYPLIEFPYPSGEGLHVGHPRGITAMDIIARKRRMEGFNVLFPIGWDAFGLPTENYAIANGIHPSIVTKDNVSRFRAQLEKLGFSFDYSREIDTTDPQYYRWTQWIFLQLFKHGLAYKGEMSINWCSQCKTGLANEEVVNGTCERCGGEIVRKNKSQWMLSITKYAQKLLDGLDDLDFLEKIKLQQRNWIGKSDGVLINFPFKDIDGELQVFTTRPDTLFGVTYMVISPEHELIQKYSEKIQNKDEIDDYRTITSKKSDFERSALEKDKTGLPLKGIEVIHPFTNRKIPVWVADYVLNGYGTGAIMAVPAHDERDYVFAVKYNLPIIQVISEGKGADEIPYVDSENGIVINSSFLNGKMVPDAKETMISFLEKEKIGFRKTNFKLRDWVFSRQRYWGEPIPIIWCSDHGAVPLDEEELPLLLPYTDDYLPTDDGESPLGRISGWVNTPCPICGKPARRETDTMPNWAGSCWYFIRYTEPENNEKMASKEALDYWLPVDWYNGGMEHTTLHLLYSRFWHRFLYDIGVLPTPEPYIKRTSHGMVLGSNGEKMSKSRKNVVNPDEIADKFGADAFRLYEMFMGGFDQAISWNDSGVRACRRFLDRVWRLQSIMIDLDDIRDRTKSIIHFTIKKVSEDYERMKFNTAIAQLMTLVNDFYSMHSVTRGEFRKLIILLNPVAPHITEELWEHYGNGERLYLQSWPVYDESAFVEREIEMAVQINGKVRGRIIITENDSEDEIIKTALTDLAVIPFLEGKIIDRTLVVKNLVSLVVK